VRGRAAVARGCAFAPALAFALALALLVPSIAGAAEPPGAVLYATHCAACHGGRVNRAPDKWFLQMMMPEAIVAALTDGVMQQQGSALSPAERVQVAEFLAGSSVRAPLHEPPRCTGRAARFDLSRPPATAGWGFDRENRRFLPAGTAKLAARDVPRLELKWAFAFPHATRARSQPLVAAGAVIVGSQDGTVYALDAETGCVRWTFRAGAEVRTGITAEAWRAGARDARPLVYFADLVARVYAVELVTGRLAWVRKVDEHPHATVTGQPVLADGRLLVPVSSREVMSAADPGYPCCTFRGSVVALDARRGEPLWRTYAIPAEPAEVGVNAAGTPRFAPSGAAVWNSPTVDLRRGLFWFGTGQNYSAPADGSSDAIIAAELATGRIRWIRQTTSRDAWNAACIRAIRTPANCPAENGVDFDYGSPPILVRGTGAGTGAGMGTGAGNAGDILVAGQKSGDVYGIDPDTGEVRWHRKVGRGGNQGGQHFGMAAEGSRVFVPITDNDREWPADAARPGLHAVDARTGELLWSTLADDVCRGRKFCDRGISVAVTAIPGIVLAGHLDGRLRGYDAATGHVAWEFDTDREFPSVSGDPAHGGSLAGAGGAVVADGRVYVSSGYGHSYHMPGNALLVFGVPRR